jgi:hypothetical protein
MLAAVRVRVPGGEPLKAVSGGGKHLRELALELVQHRLVGVPPGTVGQDARL